jgi:hypothetical protein
MDEALRAELVALIDRDDTVRERLAADGSLFAGYHPEMEAVHRANAARLAQIVDASGWPGRSRVGDDGASAAWRILQHAIGEPALMRRMLPLLQAAAARGEADLAEVAMLEDRIRVFEGRLQRYGTQYDWNDDGTAMVPMVGVEDPERVDERRAAVGLPAMQWTRPAPHGESPPADMRAHQAEGEAWARRVGWR